MKHRVVLLVGLTTAASLSVAASLVTASQAEPPTGVSATVLSRGTLDSFNVRSDPHGAIDGFRAHSTRPMDLVVRQHDYQAGSTTGWHSHPGPIFITVVSGTLTYYELDDPCTPHVVTAGQSFVDNGAGHVVRNLTAQPARDISVITAPVGGVFRTNIAPPTTSC
ncbi:MAG TPA: cupin domain-containing protein [Mycobacteriales bacterium]|nr:cupin domain-containing protein [Mycobacteriales bacterium]